MLTGEVRIFLQKSRIARLATIGVDGYPHVVPIYFMLMAMTSSLEATETTVRSRMCFQTQREQSLLAVSEYLMKPAT